MKSAPRVSIGLPVYNGEKYLERAIDSILTQTFTDFELIVSDNASTDLTADICKAYQSRDERVRYIRNKENLGAAKNFNKLVSCAKGEYFKWASYDDMLEPEYLAQCVEALDNQEMVVLCHTRSKEINENNDFIAAYDEYDAMRLMSPYPHQRFYDLIGINHTCEIVFGVFRLDALKKTNLIGSYPASDRVLIAQLALIGPMQVLPDYLFLHREHPETTWAVWGDDPNRVVWYDTAAKKGTVFQHWKIWLEFAKTLLDTRLSLKNLILCSVQLIRWPRAYWKGQRVWRWLILDLKYGLFGAKW